MGWLTPLLHLEQYYINIFTKSRIMNQFLEKRRELSYRTVFFFEGPTDDHHQNFCDLRIVYQDRPEEEEENFPAVP